MSDEKPESLRFGPLGRSCLHLCVDMQNLFAEETPWHAPWMKRILPAVEQLARSHAAETIFTRFIPARRPEEATGTWRRYYEHWSSVTLDVLPAGMVDLMPSLAELVPPAQRFDKTTYGPWQDGRLDRHLKARGIDTLVMTGGETDVCVLAAVMGAVDLGYRTIVALDALCSGSDEMHDAIVALYRSRFDQQIEAVTTAVVLEAWE